MLSQVRPSELSRLVSALCKALLKAVNTAFCIDQFRATGKKRVAACASVYVHFLNSGTSIHFVPAGAANSCFFIFWVDICFHFKIPRVQLGAWVLNKLRVLGKVKFGFFGSLIFLIIAPLRTVFGLCGMSFLLLI